MLGSQAGGLGAAGRKLVKRSAQCPVRRRCSVKGDSLVHPGFPLRGL